MENLIVIKKSEGGKDVVSARELYGALGLDKSHWSRWSKQNIVDNIFAVEKEDYVGFTIMANGNETLDFAITLDLAKKISMTVKNEKGEAVRNYFLNCEKQLKKTQVPQSYAQALLEAGRLALEVEKQQEQLQIMKPKAEFFDAVTGSKDAIDIGTSAKVLGLGIGRNKLFEFLRNENILMKGNVPTQSYIDRGWFRVIEQKYEKPDGSTHISIKTVVYQKGLDGIRKLILKTKKNVV
jgi:anti-repressor protein